MNRRALSNRLHFSKYELVMKASFSHGMYPNEHYDPLSYEREPTLGFVLALPWLVLLLVMGFKPGDPQ